MAKAELPLRWIRREVERRRRTPENAKYPSMVVVPVQRTRVPDARGIYFIQCDRLVKIGLAKSVRKRFADLSQVIPFQLELIGVVHVAAGDSLLAAERQFHDRFNALRHAGEWFRRQGDLDTLCCEMEAVRA